MTKFSEQDVELPPEFELLRRMVSLSVPLDQDASKPIVGEDRITYDDPSVGVATESNRNHISTAVEDALLR